VRRNLSARLLFVDLWTDASRAHPPVAAQMSGQFLSPYANAPLENER